MTILFSAFLAIRGRGNGITWTCYSSKRMLAAQSLVIARPARCGIDILVRDAFSVHDELVLGERVSAETSDTSFTPVGFGRSWILLTIPPAAATAMLVFNPARRKLHEE